MKALIKRLGYRTDGKTYIGQNGQFVDKVYLKLFAVTKDIKAGDGVFNCQDMTGIVQKGGSIKLDDVFIKHLKSIDVKPAYHVKGFSWYKVLGEISPEAIKFVSEGEEREVSKAYYGENDIKYKVKCECCGTFK